MQTKTYVMLTADEGMILTNGEVYGKVIALGNGDAPENYREISQADYEAFLAEQATEESEETEGETWS